MLNILVVNDYWKPIVSATSLGGTERCVTVISQTLKELGHYPIISASSDSDDSYNSIPIVKWIEPSKQYKVANNLGRLNTRSNIIPSVVQQIEDLKINYVLLNNTNQNIIRTIADYCKDHNIGVSVHIHSDIYNWGMGGQGIIDQLENMTGRGINTVAVSKYHKNRLSRGPERPTINSVIKHFYIDSVDITELKDPNLVVSASRIDKSKQNHLLLANLPDSTVAYLMGNISRLNDKDIQYVDTVIEPLLKKPNVKYVGSVSSEEVFRQMRRAKYCYDGDSDSPGSVQIVEAVLNGCYFIRPKLIMDGAAEFIHEIGLEYRIITIDQFKEGVPDLTLDQMQKDSKTVVEAFGKDSLMRTLDNLILPENDYE